MYFSRYLHLHCGLHILVTAWLYFGQSLVLFYIIKREQERKMKNVEARVREMESDWTREVKVTYS